MNEEQNTKVVQAGYAAFGKGDIPGLLALLDDNISWEGTKGASLKIPTAGLKHGKAAVGQFFKDLAENETFHSFEPRKFIAQGDTVVCLGHFAATHNKTQKKVDTDWVMIFTVANGKITKFEEFSDSAAINAAWGV
jgi:ketosteroid isomerase-like protein